ncbi:hypothetical protein BOC51_17735 [Burkholderia pseudomallei]|nr:hypothetical protein BOC51_17735 [Burkholderia pseudomallei]AUL55944.1 hypothetical protein BHT10_08715 [Burkholderia pseudomallei]
MAPWTAAPRPPFFLPARRAARRSGPRESRRLRAAGNAAIFVGMTAFSRPFLLLAGAPLRALALARLPR